MSPARRLWLAKWLAALGLAAAAGSATYFGSPTVPCAAIGLGIQGAGACTPHNYPPSATALPTVSGTPQVGQTLTCNLGTWVQNGSGFGLAHQWQSSIDSGANWSNLSGQVGTSYAPNGGDTGALLRCQEIGSNVTGSTTVYTAAAGPVTNPGGATTANVFISSAGTTTCTRNASATAYAAALSGNHVCLTADKAYTISNIGDTILVEAGSYNAQTISYHAKTPSGGCTLYPAGGPDVSGCITFQPDGGGVANGTNVVFASFFSASSYVRIKNISIPTTLIVKWNTSNTGRPCSASVPHVHDQVFDGVKSGSTAVGGFNLASVYNVSFVNGDDTAGTDAGSSSDFAAYTFGSSGNDCNATAHPGLTAGDLVNHGIYVHGNYVHDAIQTTVGLHLGCMHFRYVNDYEYSDNRTQNCAQYDLNIESQGVGAAYRTEDTGIVKDNIFGATCSNQALAPPNGSGTCVPLGPFVVICHAAGDTITNLVATYNTIYGPAQQTVFQSSSCSGSGTFAGTVFAANTVTGTNVAGNCAGAKGVGYDYNTFTAGVTCGGTHDQVGASGYVNPAPTVWDFHPAGGAAAINYAPTSFTVGSVTVACSATDVYGATRPKAGNANCSTGAAEP